MPIQVISIVGAVILLAGIQLIARNKINKNKTITVIFSITLIPVILLLILFVFTVSITSMLNQSHDSLFYKIFAVELFVFIFYLLSKCFMLPYSKLTDVENTSKSVISIDRSIKMLYCAIYVSIIIIAILTPVIIQIIKVIPPVQQFSLPSIFKEISIANILESIVAILFLIIFMLPMLGVQGLVAGYLLIIASIFLSVMIIFQYLFIINATIRIVIASKSIRKFAIIYCILMLVPILNIVSCIILIVKARNELKILGFKVGLFGVKLAREATT